MWSLFGSKSREEHQCVFKNKKDSISISNDDEKKEDLLLNLNEKSDIISEEICENKDNKLVKIKTDKVPNKDDDKFMYKATDPVSLLMKDDTNKVLKFFDSLKIKKEEKKGLELLYLHIIKDKLTNKLITNGITNYSINLDDMILAYFSSLHPTNPDVIGCWKKWVVWLDKDPFKNANINKVIDFFETNVWDIGYDDNKKPAWFIYTKYYKDTFSNDDCCLASILWIKSMFCNAKKNIFDIISLRQGCNMYVDLSHWGWNLIGWSKIKHTKDCLVAAPYSLVQIFASNTPTFILLLRNFAGKAIPPKSLKKFVILSDKNEYFEKYANKQQTPINAGGVLNISSLQWIQDRGYLNKNDTVYKQYTN